MGVMQHFDDDRRTPNYTDPQLKDKYVFNKWHTCLSQQYLCAGCFTVVNEVSTDDTVLLIENYPPSPLHFPTYWGLEEFLQPKGSPKKVQTKYSNRLQRDVCLSISISISISIDLPFLLPERLSPLFACVCLCWWSFFFSLVYAFLFSLLWL